MDDETLGDGIVLTEDVHYSVEPFWKFNSDLSFRPAVGAHLRACAEGARTDVPAREGGTALTHRLTPLMQSAESAAHTRMYRCTFLLCMPPLTVHVHQVASAPIGCVNLTLVASC